MIDQTMLVFLAVFAAIAFAILGGWLLLTPWLEKRRKQLERRMGGANESEPALRLAPSPPTGPISGWADRFDRGFQYMIERTGLDVDSGLASAIILLGGVLLGAVVYVWRQDEEPWLALPAFLLGAGVPFAFFWWRHRTWRITIRNQLPDALYLLARSMRAGRSLEQSFQLVGTQGVAPLSKEFARMSRQMDLGLSLTQVLETTADRLNLVDFNVFAAVVILHRPTGGNLPASMERLATTTRDRVHFEGQYRAATVLGRTSAAFLLGMVCFILMYLFFFDREAALRFFESSIGVTLFVSALVLQLMGLMLLFWFLRYDY